MVVKSAKKSKKAKKRSPAKKMDALIFVDTNILLDFYRIRGGGIGLHLLKLMQDHKDIIIISSQVEMEYQKNRQRVILDTLKDHKTLDGTSLQSPAFLGDATPTKIIERSVSEVKRQQTKLKRKIEAVLSNPKKNDPVFKALEQLFRNESIYNLNRENDLRQGIRASAKKRFILGYPPRKRDDFSLGDAVNWEWIIHCAIQSKKDIIIVTRDSDYGVTYDGDSILNDWLSKEFKERVAPRRKIVITERLAKAFELVKIQVNKEAAKEEEALLHRPLEA